MILLNKESIGMWMAEQAEHKRYEYDLKHGDLLMDIGSFTNEWSNRMNQNQEYRILKFEAQHNTGAWKYNGTIKLGGTTNAMSMYDYDDQL